ncbi:MAG: GBS Bsp-like repeat-containing protein [Roseburia sp.]|nr:GBS Bsp-like repeat-containing protein [Roseburia sp.]MCM1278107.1 GBS Bsp-like repeat-containing protein [Robinsoniella sp.]
MKAFWKRGISIFLAALMMIQVPAMPVVQAQTISENDVEDQEIILEEMTEDISDGNDGEEIAVSENTAEEEEDFPDVDTVSENTIEATLLNWVYVEKPYIKTPDTQNILISIGNEETDIIEGSLTYENTATNEKFEMKASKAEGTAFGDSLFFSKEFAALNEKGIYKLLEVSYRTDNEQQVIDLANTAGIQAFFGVEEEVIASDERMEISTEIVTIDENGQETKADSIESAIEAAQAETVTSRSASLYARAGAKKDMVIVLDPGHDNTHAGARGNGLKEEELTFKIASYCKEQLETYSGVTVYLTRTGYACPYPGTSSTECNLKRVEAAKKVGADVFVSIHLNTSPASSASGAEVYYPNSSYNSEIGAEGKGLATEIQKKLAAIGLANRGIKIRNSEDNSLYPDGSLADYYGVIKNSKLNGFPGIIIEHAFLTNSSDAGLLSTEAGLKKLGKADADGIAEYYKLGEGGSEEPEVEFSSGKLSIIDKDLAAGTFTAHIVDVEPYEEVSKVVFKVWTKADKSDLKSYKAVDMEDGSFEASISAAKHNKAEGKYYVYAYAVDEENREQLLKKTSVMLTPSFTDVSVSRKVTGDKSQYYKVTVSGLEEAQKVNLRLWYNKSGSNSAVTYKAKKTSSGDWYYNIPLSKMPKEGKYKLEIKATAAYGTEKSVKTVSFTYKRSATVSVAKTSNTQKKFKVRLEGMGYAKKVSFQVWSKTGGKDDLKTYKGKKGSDGTWAYNIPINKHKTAGTYYVVAVAQVENETVTFAKKSFKVTGPSAQSVKLQNQDTQALTFDAVVSGIYSPAGFSKKVEYAVWCKSDKSDKKTYKAKVKKDGTSKITVNVKNHKNNLGTYKVQVTLIDDNGIKTTLATKKINVTKSKKNTKNYPIMGTSETDLDQMVAYFEDNAEYPEFYEDSDAPTIEAFCKLYLSESKAEGVKAEVAFIQAMKETNFLKYGGDVDISQYNFAGLGATGGGASGASFESVKIGIRAQVQHLKAYATTEPLNKACVDDRYSLVTKGCAPYVQWLGTNENPTGKGWATDPGYGNDIVKRIADLKTY